MKKAAKAEKDTELLAGTEALDLYLRALSSNLGMIKRQTDVLETAIIEIKSSKLVAS